MMEMMNPPHVGEMIRYEVLEPLGLKVTEAAKVLGVSRPALSNLLNGRAALSGLAHDGAFRPTSRPGRTRAAAAAVNRRLRIRCLLCKRF